MDSSPFAIVIRDAEGKHVYCNNQYMRIIKIQSEEEIKDKKYDVINISKFDMEEIRKKDNKVLKTKNTISYTKTIIENNEKHIVDITKSPWIKDGKIEGIITVIKENSYNKEIKRLREGFFYNMKHEIRTPINVIFSAIQLMKQKINQHSTIKNDESIQKQIDTIVNNTLRLNKLSKNFIDLTSLDFGNVEYTPNNYDIVSTVENLCIDIKRYTNLEYLTIIFDTEFEEKIITFDKMKLERIVMNIISNSVKFNEGKRNIEVYIYEEDNMINISIKDDGYGIEEEKLEKIFQPFNEVENRINKIREGSAVGLTLAQRFVEMHGGKIQVKSEIGGGSEFIIKIPNIYYEDLDNNNWVDKTDTNTYENIVSEFSDIYE